MPRRITLTTLALALALVAPAAAATTGATGATGSLGPTPPPRGSTYHFLSRPDLTPPSIDVGTSQPGLADGDLFLAPKLGQGQGGPMIVDNAGNLVYFDPEPGAVRANDFRVQSYQGKPVLTWWEGLGAGGFGRGEGVIMNQSYQVIARVKAGNDQQADLHEFLLTPKGTAYVTAYHPVRRDLRAYGGAKDGYVLEAIIEEVDVKTGKVLWEWHSLYHVGVGESEIEPPAADSADYFDYFHINSIDVDKDGNLLVSGRLTGALYKISRKTGNVIWRLGGTHSDFRLGPGADFARQHDARWQPDGSITLFDNSALTGRHRSRALHLAVDVKAKRATVINPVLRQGKFFAPTEGNVQTLPNANTFVGWGSRGRASEFSPGGTLLYDLRLAAGYDSYRVFRLPWSGQPLTRPTLTVTTVSGRQIAAVSWNGATTVAGWQLLSGGTGGVAPDGAPLGTQGFETRVDVTGKQLVALRALDADGNTLGQSKPVRVVVPKAPANAPKK